MSDIIGGILDVVHRETSYRLDVSGYMYTLYNVITWIPLCISARGIQNWGGTPQWSPLHLIRK